MQRIALALEPAPDLDAAPSISVLMAVRNGEQFLDEAIASILSQSFGDLELVLIDNGSRDRTPEIIDAWAKKDARLRAFRLDRPGLARSLNFAASRARGWLLARLDADDVAEPERLARQYAAMLADDTLGAVGTNASIIDHRGRVLGEVRRAPGREGVRQFLAHGNPFVHSTVMFRRSLFEQVGGYREGMRATEDFDLWLRMAEIGELDLIAEPLVRYRHHLGSMTQRQGSRIALAAVCARAAVRARRTGEKEPFASGRPQLRRALPLLGIDRGELRQAIVEQLRRERFELRFARLPLPSRVKTGIRRGLVAIGLKPLFGLIMARSWRRRV